MNPRGFHDADFQALFPLSGKQTGILVSNHESEEVYLVDPAMSGGPGRKNAQCRKHKLCGAIGQLETLAQAN